MPLVLIVFLASTVLVVYVLAIYPLILAWLARAAPRPVRKSPKVCPVTVLLPVHNGARWLGEKLNSLAALDFPLDQLEILLLDDGSTDDTVRVAEEAKKRSPHLEIVKLDRGGKARALNRGIEIAKGEILFFTDVRQTLDPESLHELLACLADPEVGVVSGELIITGGQTHAEANVGMYWRHEKWIRRRLSAVHSVPGATGAIYAMRRRLAVPMPVDTLADDVFLPLGAYFQGYRIVFEERARAYDYPTGLEQEFRRKVRTLAGVYQIIAAYPRLLLPNHPLWIHFVSHKLGRLALPWALIALGLTSFFLPAPLRDAALAAQGAFYLVALVDRVLPEAFPFKRQTSAVRTFVVFMAAAFCAVAIWFVPARALWKPLR